MTLDLAAKNPFSFMTIFSLHSFFPFRFPSFYFSLLYSAGHSPAGPYIGATGDGSALDYIYIPEQFTVKAHPALFEGKG